MVVGVSFENTTFGNSGWFWGGKPTGGVNSTAGIFSCWINPSADASSQHIVRLGDRFFPYFDVRWSSTNYSFSFTIWDLVNVKINGLEARGFPQEKWHHILVSWGSPTDQFKAWINDVLMIDATTQNPTLQLPFDNASQENTFFNADDRQTLSPFIGCAADLYFNIAETLDFTVEANRRKFVTADIRHVPLGSTGQTPTGSSPIYAFLNDGTNFNENLGTGGDPGNEGTNIAICSDPLDKDDVVLTLPTIVIGTSYENTTFQDSGWFWGGVPYNANLSTVGIMSVWAKPTGTASQTIVRLGNQALPFLNVRWSSSGGGRFFFTVWDEDEIHISLSAAVYATDLWHHVLISWGSPTDQFKVWINDVLDLDATATNTPLQIPINRVLHNTFFNNDERQTLAPWLGCGADLYINTEETLDFTVVANRRKFITADLTRVSLGAGAALPTGNSPIYAFLNDGVDVNVNHGTGGYTNTTLLEGTNPTFCYDCPLDVMLAATVTKAFSVSDAPTGQRVTMTITITNPNNPLAAGSTMTDVSFTDTLPTGMVVPLYAGVATNSCGGTLTAEAGASIISLSGGTIIGGASCVVTVELESQIPGVYANTVTIVSFVGSLPPPSFGEVPLEVTSDPSESVTVTYYQDKVYVQPDEHLTFRPDPRIYRNAVSTSPKSGKPLESLLDILSGLDEQDDIFERGPS